MAEQYTQNHKTITGKVDRIVFHDQTTGRSILSIIKEDGKYCRVIGNVENVAIEDILKATGRWNKDEKYGWQFIAESIEKGSQTDEKNDGFMHAVDFSNVLNIRLKEYRNGSGIGDYSEYNIDNLKIVNIDGVIYSGDKTTLISAPADITSVEIPDTVTNIGWRAFKNCKNITSIIIPKSVISIDSEAFSGCLSLTSVTIANSVKSIGDRTFYKCSLLENLVVPDTVTHIGEGAFDDCKSYHIDQVFNASWGNVKFFDNSISVFVNFGNSSLFFDDYNLNKGCEGATKLQTHFDGVDERMNKIKDVLKSTIPNLKVRMLSKNECEIVNKDQLQKALFIDETIDMTWDDVCFGLRDIYIPSPKGNKVRILDEKMFYMLNGICRDLTRLMPVLRVHFLSLVDAEILNIDELHKITDVLDTKKIFSNSEIPDRLRDVRKKYFRSLLPRKMSPYIQFLFDKHAIDTYPIVLVEENMVITAKEKGALFTIIVDGLPHIVWENFNDTRATYVFKCTEEDYEDRRKLILDFIKSYRVNKRSYLHSNACISIFGEKPRMVAHNDFASWTQRLMCYSELEPSRY